MTISLADKFFEEIQVDKGRIALDPSEVKSLVDYLARERGIVFPGSVNSWEELLQTKGDRYAVETYREAHDEVVLAMRRGKKQAITTAEEPLYNAIAHPSVLGPIKSQRRHFILDSLCITIGLVRNIREHGAIIDVGCHARFVSTALSPHLDCRVVGIDPSANDRKGVFG